MGRTSLLMVMGFNIIFATMGFTISNVSDWAYKNYVGYYQRSVARQIAGTAANIAASDLTFTPNWRVGSDNASTYTDIPFMGGTYSITTTEMDSARVRINVIARYDSVTYTDTLLLGLSNFSKFAYFSNSEGSINWATGDTVWGPFHTQDAMNIDGNPVFEGRTTAKNGYTKTTGSQPQFLGGYESGVNIPLPPTLSNMDSVARVGGYWLGVPGRRDVYIALMPNGTAVFRYSAWSNAPFNILKLDSLPFNGVVAVDSCNVHLKGVLKGRLTIACLQRTSSSVKAGNFWLDSSVVYKSDPIVYPDSVDMLGLVCDNNLWIKDTSYNNIVVNGFTIQASMLSRNGGFGAEHYDSRGPAAPPGGYCGQIYLLGGVQQFQRQAVGTIGGTRPHTYIATGFGKNYNYDSRLLIMGPPLYPTTGAYEVLSWFEDVKNSGWFWKTL